jgi:serine phosphatase RsbU (regulator of sigma subunit)
MEPALVLRVSGAAEQIESIGPAIGILPGSVFEARTVSLAPPDTVIITTDGITEARHGSVFLGMAGVAELAQRAGSAKSLRDLSQAIYSGARDFAGGDLRDDACILLARRA